MKRIVTLFLSLVLLLSCLCAPASAMFDPSLFYEVQAKSAYIVNTDTNIIVYDKDSSRQVSAGGLTKYMTIALLLTNYADQLDNTFQMPFAISDYVHNSDNADMRSNEAFTYREAVYAMLLRNANEAAMGLAYSLSGGDLAGWVSQMNTLSQRIGTTGSTWTDACGLDSGNVTTAVDMYLILRYLMSFDAFVDISSAPTFTMPAKEKHAKSFVLLNQNVALNKTSGGSFYRKSMQGGMCDVMAYKKTTTATRAMFRGPIRTAPLISSASCRVPTPVTPTVTPTAARPSMRRPASSTGCSRAFPSSLRWIPTSLWQRSP